MRNYFGLASLLLVAFLLLACKEKTNKVAANKPAQTPFTLENTSQKPLAIELAQTPFTLEDTLQEPPEVEARSSRWSVQLTQIANKKAEAEHIIRQLQFDLNRFTTARDALIREKQQKMQQMVAGTIEGTAKSKTFGDAVLEGLAGGALTSLVADGYDRRIAKVSSNIATLTDDLSAWQTELDRLGEWEMQCIGWSKYRGHVYPVVRNLEAGGLAAQLGLQKGDLFLSYNGHSLAYANTTELSKPREEAKRLKLSKVEIVFARGGNLIRHQVAGGKLLGLQAVMPIHE